MVTFNQEAYIGQAIDSVIAQECPFPYELLISDDRSTDGTWSIVAEYQSRYPTLIRALRSDHNRGPQRNLVETLRACNGRYVALLDGDDYWLSSDKLRKQVAVLDSHPECAICCSRVRVVYQDGSREPWEYPLWERTWFTLEDLIRENFIPTCTAVFRLGLLLDFPAWFEGLPFGDWALHILLAQCGDIMVMPETLAAYRIHDKGLWSQKKPEEIAACLRIFFEVIEAHLPASYGELIREVSAGSAPGRSK